MAYAEKRKVMECQLREQLILLHINSLHEMRGKKTEIYTEASCQVRKSAAMGENAPNYSVFI